MDITITNYRGYTTIKIGGDEVHYRQKREDFLKEGDINIILQSIYTKNEITHTTTHDECTLSTKKEIGIYDEKYGWKLLKKEGKCYDAINNCWIKNDQNNKGDD